MLQRTYPKSWRRLSWKIPWRRRNRGLNPPRIHFITISFCLENPSLALSYPPNKNYLERATFFFLFGLLFSILSALLSMKKSWKKRPPPSLFSPLPSLLRSLKKDFQPTALKRSIIIIIIIIQGGRQDSCFGFFFIIFETFSTNAVFSYQRTLHYIHTFTKQRIYKKFKKKKKIFRDGVGNFTLHILSGRFFLTSS